MCGLVAQLVEHRNGIEQLAGSTRVDASFPNCLKKVMAKIASLHKEEIVLILVYGKFCPLILKAQSAN